MRVTTFALLLLTKVILLSKPFPLYAAVDGAYYCSACTAVVEGVQIDIADAANRISAKLQRGQAGSMAHIDYMGIIAALCENSDFRRWYRDDIQEGCRRLSKTNRVPLAYQFSGDPPLPHIAYKRATEFCVKKLKVCDEDLSMIQKLPSKSQRPCWLCGIFSADLREMLRRHQAVVAGIHTRNDFWHVLNNICSTIAIRYPHGLGSALEGVCDDVVEEYGGEIFDILSEAAPLFGNLGERICGNEVTALCPIATSLAKGVLTASTFDASSWWWFQRHQVTESQLCNIARDDRPSQDKRSAAPK